MLCRRRREDGTAAQFLMMENITLGYTKSCIMDIKVRLIR